MDDFSQEHGYVAEPATNEMGFFSRPGYDEPNRDIQRVLGRSNRGGVATTVHAHRPN